MRRIELLRQARAEWKRHVREELQRMLASSESSAPADAPELLERVEFVMLGELRETLESANSAADNRG